MAGPSLVKLPKRTFGARIADQLRDAILNGDIAPGQPIVEATLAAQFGVSRGPLREAIRHLIDEGLLVQIPFTGTRVVDLSATTVDEIYSMRTVLETFAFELVWGRRNKAFRDELKRRQSALNDAIDAGDDVESINRELDLHGLVFEAAGHEILMQNWTSLRGRLQLYWAANHRAHGRRGPQRDAHDSYLKAALGDDFAALKGEIGDHMRRGAEVTTRFILATQAAQAPARAS